MTAVFSFYLFIYIFYFVFQMILEAEVEKSARVFRNRYIHRSSNFMFDRNESRSSFTVLLGACPVRVLVYPGRPKPAPTFGKTQIPFAP